MLGSGVAGRESDVGLVTVLLNSPPLIYLFICSDGVSKYSTTGSGSLRISAVAEEDAGDYYCRAENTEDSVDAPASLQVLGS